MPNRNRLIAKIHTLKSKLNWDDAQYREVLFDIAQKQSCTQMSIVELINASNYMQAQIGNVPLLPIRKKIYAQWGELFAKKQVRNGTKKACDNWTATQIGCSIHQLDELQVGAFMGPVEALKSWIHRASK